MYDRSLRESDIDGARRLASTSSPDTLFLCLSLVLSIRLCYPIGALKRDLLREKMPIKITVLVQYFCTMFISLYILYCRIVKNKVLGIIFYSLLCKFYCSAE